MSRAILEERLVPKAPAPVRGSSSYEKIGRLAVAAGAPNGGRHAAFLYRSDETKEIRLFELKGHHALADGTVRKGYAWVEPRVPPDRVDLVIGAARLICDAYANGEVPYGFRYKKSTFDESGMYVLADGEIGFTCATLIAALFESEGYVLLDPETWPPAGEEDKRRRTLYIESLRASTEKTDQERAELLQAEIDVPRISPEDVVTAAAMLTAAAEPATYEHVVGAGLCPRRSDQLMAR